MDSKANRDEELIVSYFHNQSDTQDDIPSNLTVTEDYKETERIFNLRGKVAFLHTLSREDQLWNRINRQLHRKKLVWSWGKYAAIIFLSFICGSLLIYFIGASVHKPLMASITSPRGQITSLTLFDGTTVWLNSESTIKYSSDFGKRKRNVYVQGEAYFEVTHDRKKPFIVHLGNSQVKVYGTKFNVIAYPGTDHIEAVLMKGKIEFTANNQSILLKPHDRVVFYPQKGILKKDHADIQKVSAWKKGKYYYDDERLSTILQQLQRWYDIEFVFNEKELSSYTFTGVINRGKSIQYNLKLIELTNKINAEFKNDKIIITRK